MRYYKTQAARRLVAETLRPKDYSAINNPRTRESKETLRRRAVRLAQRINELESALAKILEMEPVPGADLPTFIDRAGAVAEARLVLASERFWNGDSPR